jgi:hypothetical protein
MPEPYKWSLNPHAALGEIARQEEDPGYFKTICGVLRTLYVEINVDCNGYIPQDNLDRVNELLEKAFRMGKRMDYRLHEYFRLVNKGMTTQTHQFTDEIEFPESPTDGDKNGKQGQKVKGKK